jgi:hypothetical protein
MTGRLRAAGRLARPRAGRRAAAARRVRRAGLAALRLIVSFTGWIGAAVLAAMHDLPWWSWVLVWTPVMLAGGVIFFLPARIGTRDDRTAVFWVCRAMGVACAFALFAVLTIGFQNQRLQEHGVIERAVVTGKSSLSEDDGMGLDEEHYFYSLRALAGPAINDTVEGPGTLSPGDHVTVLADPGVRDSATLDTSVSASGQLLAADGLAAAAAAFFAVAAWRWPQRPAEA